MSAHDDYLDPDRHDPALQDDDGDSQAMAVLTLRDYFAAKAMAAILSTGEGMDLDVRARGAYRIADAMLKERVK